jgi:hypothetical protein
MGVLVTVGDTLTAERQVWQQDTFLAVGPALPRVEMAASLDKPRQTDILGGIVGVGLPVEFTSFKDFSVNTRNAPVQEEVMFSTLLFCRSDNNGLIHWVWSSSRC